MNGAAARASYRRGLEAGGHQVHVRRYTGTGAARPYHDYGPVLARSTDYRPDELTGPVQQGDRRVLMLAEDLEIAGFPMPVRNGDKILLRGAELNVEAADDSTRRVGAVLLAVEVRARG